MASQAETRILRLESLLRPLQDQVAQLRDQVAQLKQQQYGMSSGAGGGGGGGGQPFFADHLSIAGISGLLTVPPTPHSITSVSVYQLNGGSFVLVTSSATVINPLPDATDNTKRQILMKNTDGTYSVVGQSCTSP